MSKDLDAQLERGPGPRPRTALEIADWARRVLDVEIVCEPLLVGSSSPLEYLAHAFLRDFGEPDAEGPDAPPADCAVWACRGGGKTFYAALATTLDLIYKPGVNVQILAGSLLQSRRMYEHLRTFFERPALASLVDGRITARRLRLRTGSVAETLAQSHTSVRGVRPQKLRCDEVDLFDPDVWRAAQLVTRSRRCGSAYVRGAVEALSTMHRPGGLMSTLIAQGQAGSTRRIFRWSVVDALEVCPPARKCEGCALYEECGGRAKRSGQAHAAGGHITISDALTHKSRSDQATWQSEMLCLRPRLSDIVFPEFDPDVHVRAFETPHGDQGVTWLCGMDFGFRAPTAILWACIEHETDMLRIVDERIVSERTLAEHIRVMREARPPRRLPAWVAVDPAGRQRSDQTGVSNFEALRMAGLPARAPRVPVEEGLRAIRARLAPATGPARLCIHPRCAGLIEALQTYHYPARDLQTLVPAKDGPDHAVDALRYLVQSLDLGARRRGRLWLY